ncbi:MAG: hypothetical protein II511_04140 [Bacteroidales bacterium]|nr:hypothetical protein [Bacteroidales bacterium]
MKTVFKFALMGFAASVLALSCSKSDTTPEGEDPVENGKAGATVNANFVFNVSTGNTPATKMTSANAQATIFEAFRGIDNAQLFAYKLGTTNDGKHVATATTAAKTYGLGKILGAGELDPDGSPKSRRVIELALPVETNALMFWGKAIKSGTDDQQGKVTFAASNADISNHAFALVPRVESGSDKATQMAHYQEIIATLINHAVQTTYHADLNSLTFDGQKNDGVDGRPGAIDLKWSDFVEVSSSGVITPKTVAPLNPSLPMCSLGEILADAFKTFNTVYDNEARAGSGPSVTKMMTDLHAVIDKVAEATPVSWQEFVAKQVAIAIRLKISEFTANGTSANAISTLKNNAGLASYTDVSNEVADFPAVVPGLPMGAAQLTVTISQTAPVATWAYTNDVHSGISGVTHNVYNYTYPAELCYFGNSAIRVSNDPHVTNDYPDGTDNWLDNSKWTADWSAIGKHVLSTTRSVAMGQNINYGTSLLKTSVAFASGVTELEDNNAAIQQARTGATEENNKFEATAGQFTLTGILVGGQTKTVGWDYTSKDGSFNYVVYDKDIVSAAVPTPANEETYTLVWDNYTTGGTQNFVYVALEFTNATGKDFWGEVNLVRAGGTFYLIGKLDPTDASLAAITWPTDYALPPYNADGSTIQEKRVFIQDYMTTANFVLNKTSLQHAYVTVPDLRSTQISLGLSVDLAWSTGLKFDNIVLGQ